MIGNKIQQMIGEAMKARDQVRLSTLKLLSSAFNYEKIEKRHDLTEEEELTIIRREAKKRREAAEAYEKAGSKDRAEQETKELVILQEFLPAEISDSDLQVIVDAAVAETGASTISDMGKVMGIVKEKTSGNADGAKVAQMVRAKLNG